MMNDRRKFVKRAQDYYKAGRLDLAIKEFQKILEIDSNDMIAILTLGNIYSKQQKYEQAISMYQRLIEIFLNTNEFTKALGYCDRVIKILVRECKMPINNIETEPFRFHSNASYEEYKIIHPIHLDEDTLQSFANAAEYARQRLSAMERKVKDKKVKIKEIIE